MAVTVHISPDTISKSLAHIEGGYPTLTARNHLRGHFCSPRHGRIFSVTDAVLGSMIFGLPRRRKYSKSANIDAHSAKDVLASAITHSSKHESLNIKAHKKASGMTLVNDARLSFGADSRKRTPPHGWNTNHSMRSFAYCAHWYA